MAIRIDAVSEYLSRTTNLPPIASYTIMCWAYLVTGRSTYSIALRFGNTSSTWYQYGLLGDGVQLGAWNGITETGGTTWTAGTWKHLAMTCAGTGAGQFICYQNGTVDVTLAGSASQAAQTLMLGTNAPSGEYFSGRLAAAKIYSAALTVSEIQQEMRYYVPIRTANLNTWSPLMAATDVGNYAANPGTAWTTSGTLTTEDGPPIAWEPTPRMLPWRGAVAAGILETQLERRVPRGLHRGILRGVA